MNERPILFRDDMVLAILAGTKTVTRRVGPTWARVQAGDRLWVREAHTIVHGPCWSGLPSSASRAAFVRVWQELHGDYVGPVWRVEFAVR